MLSYSFSTYLTTLVLLKLKKKKLNYCTLRRKLGVNYMTRAVHYSLDKTTFVILSCGNCCGKMKTTFYVLILGVCSLTAISSGKAVYYNHYTTHTAKVKYFYNKTTHVLLLLIYGMIIVLAFLLLFKIYFQFKR